MEQIASHTGKNPLAVRRAVGLAVATRRLDAQRNGRLQVARLTKAPRCAAVSLEEEIRGRSRR
jgi:hypothetical protein